MFKISSIIGLLTGVLFLNGCGGESHESTTKIDKNTDNSRENKDTSNNCTISNFSLVKQMIADKGHITKLACNGAYVALLMQKYSDKYLEHNNVILLDMTSNDILFESNSHFVTDIHLSDKMTLVYTESNLEGLTQSTDSMGEYKLNYRDIPTGTTTSAIIHHENYTRDYASASLRVLPIGEIWLTSYRKNDGSPWLSGWKLNQEDKFEQVFAKQLAPNFDENGFNYLLAPIGGSLGALEQFTRQQFISLTEDPVNKNTLSVSFSAPSLGTDDVNLLDYLDLFNQFTGSKLEYISTKRSPAGVDVIVTQVDSLGKQINNDILGTTHVDENFGLTSYQGKPLIFGRARTSTALWEGYLATTGLANSHLSLNTSSVITAAIATQQGLLASGTVGWDQNPNGFSISENADVELMLIDDKLSEMGKLTLASSARFNRIFGFMPLHNHVYLAYGMENGPGTHSADHNISQLASTPLMIQVTIENDNSISHVIF